MIVAENDDTVPRKIDIVSIKMVRDSTLMCKRGTINSPSDAVDVVGKFIEDMDREEMIVCCLDVKNRPVALNIVSIGSLNSSVVTPREVFKVAILSNAASVMLFHNHPSGDPYPSNEDINTTDRLKKCGDILGIELLDHIIIGYKKYYSLRSEGKM